MNRFKEKEILSARTLGDKLRQAREEDGLTLETAEKDTKIRKEYLDCLERGEYKKLPGEIYIKNFLATYAKFLHLSEERVLALYEEEKKVYQKISPLEKHPKKGHGLVSTHPLLNPRFIRSGLAALAVLALLFYLGLELNKMVSPPFLAVDSPKEDNFTISQYSVEVAGRTEKETKILINGQEVLGDQNGNFKTIIDLNEGINVLRISAVKSHSKESVVYKRIMVNG